MSLLGDSLGSTLACNARNRVFRSLASLTNSFESFVESLQNIKCPSFQPGEGSFSKPERLLPDGRVQVLLNDIASVTWDDISQSVSKCQWLDESLGLEARDWLWWHKFCGGIWDKKAHRNYAVCRVLDDIRMCDGILFGKRFTLAGWGPTPRDAQATTLIQLLDSANECGVLGDADAFRRLPPNLTPDNVTPWVMDLLPPGCDDDSGMPEPPVPEPHGFCVTIDGVSVRIGDVSNPAKAKKQRFGSPSIFGLLKWKSEETAVPPFIRWRDVVSFAAHPLRAWSKLMGRCLQLLVCHCTMLPGGLGFAKLVGVRDLVWSAYRMQASMESLSLLEQDMSDMFWEIPGEEALQAVSWAVGECKKKLRGKTLWFSLSKEAKCLDRLGKSADRQFTVVNDDHLTRFVKFDLQQNVLFVLGSLILRPGGKGVPIGGFISAQLAELWALWKEHTQLMGEQNVRTHFESALNQCIATNSPPGRQFLPPHTQGPSQLLPAPSVQGFVTGPTDFSASPVNGPEMTVCEGIMRVRLPPLVSWEQLHSNGFRGWWAPVESLVAVLQVDDVPIFLVKSTPWDGAPAGRLSTILRYTPQRDKHKVGEHLKGFEVLKGIVGELRNPPPRCTSDSPIDGPSLPFVLMGRYRDNIYLLMSRIPPHIRPWVEFGVACFLRSTYGIPLKWEPHPQGSVNWGECLLRVLPQRISMLRKGVCLSLSDLDGSDDTSDLEWSKWVDPLSPNARLVWQSLLPAIFLKCIWYAWNSEDVLLNCRSMVWGLVHRRVPGSWWKARLRRLYDFWEMQHFFPLHMIYEWQKQARSLRTDGDLSSLDNGDSVLPALPVRS